MGSGATAIKINGVAYSSGDTVEVEDGTTISCTGSNFNVNLNGTQVAANVSSYDYEVTSDVTVDISIDGKGAVFNITTSSTGVA